MVVSVWAPSPLGKPRITAAILHDVRRYSTNTGVYGAFRLEIPAVGNFPECRLMRRKDGPFFSRGEWLLDRDERTYLGFVDFLDPFSTWLARAARLEMITEIENEDLGISEENEPLLLTSDELLDRAEPERLSPERLIGIEIPKQKGRLVTRRHHFNAIIGESIRIRGCSLTGKPGMMQLVMPTSEGLKLRPIQLERALSAEIARRAEGHGITPQPRAA